MESFTITLIPKEYSADVEASDECDALSKVLDAFDTGGYTLEQVIVDGDSTAKSVDVSDGFAPRRHYDGFAESVMRGHRIEATSDVVDSSTDDE